MTTTRVITSEAAKPFFSLSFQRRLEPTEPRPWMAMFRSPGQRELLAARACLEMGSSLRWNDNQK
jgi:hypothetical protein